MMGYGMPGYLHSIYPAACNPKDPLPGLHLKSVFHSITWEFTLTKTCWSGSHSIQNIAKTNWIWAKAASGSKSRSISPSS
jgi:hypothetical protein